MTKNNIISFSIAMFIAIMTFISFSNEADAQCQTGFIQKFVTMTVGDCDYEVEICVYCGEYTPSGHTPGEAYIISLTRIPQTPECSALPIQQVLDQIYSQIRTWNFIDMYLCIEFGTLDPCQEPFDPNSLTNTFTVTEYVCWEKALVLLDGQETLMYTPCNYDDYCEVTYGYCYEPYTGEIHRVIVSSNSSNTISCTLEGYEVPDPIKRYVPSDCFIYHTTCEE